MDLVDLGWRGAVLLVVALVAAYLAVSLARLARLRRRRSVEAPPTVAATAPAEVPAALPFADQLALSGLEAEVGLLRAELAALRQEVEQLKAAPHVSPLYAEAMALARRGFDAQGIADECGISVAEAELVLAMSRDGKSLDDEGSHGGTEDDDGTGPAGR